MRIINRVYLYKVDDKPLFVLTQRKKTIVGAYGPMNKRKFVKSMLRIVHKYNKSLPFAEDTIQFSSKVHESIIVQYDLQSVARISDEWIFTEFGPSDVKGWTFHFKREEPFQINIFEEPEAKPNIVPSARQKAKPNVASSARKEKKSSKKASRQPKSEKGAELTIF
jgi:hypothetical protein